MILRTLVVIPVFDNESTIRQVVEQTLRDLPFPVCVVDDGSRKPVTEILNCLKDQRLNIIRHHTNQGKGSAIQTAFQEAIRRGFTHVLTIDGDGQHIPAQAMRLMREACKDPGALVIGARQFDKDAGKTQGEVPRVSRFGRWFSNFWVRYETGSRVADSQSGFRLYPLFPLQHIRFFSKRYEFEIEVLIRAMWLGVPLREVEVEVIYPSDRVTHFRKFWDNARISVLNTLLVTVSLIRAPGSTWKLACSMGAGVFVGCTPFYGLHFLIAVIVSLVFRLNVVMTLVGTHISTPPLVAFIIFACVSVGSAVLHQPAPHWDVISKHPDVGQLFWQWLVGSVIVGSLLGTIFGALTAWAASIMRPRTASVPWTGKIRGGSFGNRFLVGSLRSLGLPVTRKFLVFIVPYFFAVSFRTRRSMLEYQKLIHPSDGRWQRYRKCLKQLSTFANILLDRVYASYFSDHGLKAISTGFENISKPVKSGQGVLVLGAHVGAWNMSSVFLKSHGCDFPIHVVMYGADGLTLEKFQSSQEEIPVIPIAVNQVEQPILEIHERLGNRNAVSMLADRAVGPRFELVRFLGRLAPMSVTPFKLAAATGVPLVVSLGAKTSTDQYAFYALPPRVLSYSHGEPRELQVCRWIEDFIRDLEDFLRKYPEQWFNFYPFWSEYPFGVSTGQSTQSTNQLLEELHKPLGMGSDSEFGDKSNVGQER